jgi:hypothetical protein
VTRFAARPDVTLLHGDSGSRLPEVLGQLTEPALFWLDAHYSGPITARGPLDSPIGQELEAIAAHPVGGHVVLIDDMRDFNGTGGYPEAAALVEDLRRKHPADVVEIRDDVLRWHARPDSRQRAAREVARVAARRPERPAEDLAHRRSSTRAILAARA